MPVKTKIIGKHAEDLAKEYELGKEDYKFFEYIIDSLINGQRQQVRNLFNLMSIDSKHSFLIDYLDPAGQPLHLSIMKICIIEML